MTKKDYIIVDFDDNTKWKIPLEPIFEIYTKYIFEVCEVTIEQAKEITKEELNSPIAVEQYLNEYVSWEDIKNFVEEVPKSKNYKYILETCKISEAYMGGQIWM
jgi:hypothetical protein